MMFNLKLQSILKIDALGEAINNNNKFYYSLIWFLKGLCRLYLLYSRKRSIVPTHLNKTQGFPFWRASRTLRVRSGPFQPLPSYPPYAYLISSGLLSSLFTISRRLLEGYTLLGLPSRSLVLARIARALHLRLATAPHAPPAQKSIVSRPVQLCLDCRLDRVKPYRIIRPGRVFKPNGQQFLVVGLLQAGLYKLDWTWTVLQGFLNLDFSQIFLYLVYLATIFRKNLEKIDIFSSFFLKIASVGLLSKTRYYLSTSTLFNRTRVQTAILGPRAYLGPNKKFENPVRPYLIYSLPTPLTTTLIRLRSD